MFFKQVENWPLLLQPDGEACDCCGERHRPSSSRLRCALWPLGQRHCHQVCWCHPCSCHNVIMSSPLWPLVSVTVIRCVIHVIVSHVLGQASPTLPRDRRSLRRRPPVPLAGFRTKTIRHAHNPFYRWETPYSRFHNSLFFLSPAKPLWQMYNGRTWRWHYGQKYLHSITRAEHNVFFVLWHLCHKFSKTTLRLNWFHKEIIKASNKTFPTKRMNKVASTELWKWKKTSGPQTTFTHMSHIPNIQVYVISG